jgi:N6-adenosine-specific RNA methylase IME4
VSSRLRAQLPYQPSETTSCRALTVNQVSAFKILIFITVEDDAFEMNAAHKLPKQ